LFPTFLNALEDLYEIYHILQLLHLHKKQDRRPPFNSFNTDRVWQLASITPNQEPLVIPGPSAGV
jgi:hypothetical protein